jgi:hypothetical protein
VTARTRLAAAAIAAAAILALTACSTAPSYDDLVNTCAKAVEARPAGAVGKPKACEQIRQDDYDVINVAHIIDNVGK